MLKSSFLVFIVGWITWFWIDNPGVRQFQMPPVSDSMLDNFRTAFAMLKAGYIDPAFLFLWQAHYLVLSLLLGALLAVAYNSITDYLGRKRMRRHFLPPARRQASSAADTPPVDTGKPADQDHPNT